MKVFAHFQIMGDEFSPRDFESFSAIEFHTKDEKGDLVWPGDGQGQRFPYGSASLEFSSPDGLRDPKFLTWLKLIEDHMAAFRKAGATDIWLTITMGYINQGKLEIPASVVKGLAKLGMWVGLTFYETDS